MIFNIEVHMYKRSGIRTIYTVKMSDFFQYEPYMVNAHGAIPKVKRMLYLTDVFNIGEKYTCSEALTGLFKLKKYTNEKIYDDLKLQLLGRTNHTIKDTYFIVNKSQ